MRPDQTRCTITTKGGYRCYRKAGHQGACEIDTPIGSMKVTPGMVPAMMPDAPEVSSRPLGEAKLRQVTFPYQYQEDRHEFHGTVTPIRPGIETAPSWRLCPHDWRFHHLQEATLDTPAAYVYYCCKNARHMLKVPLRDIEWLK